MASVELQQIGPYTITQLLGESATSKFYLGRHQQRKKDVIIKVLLIPLTTNEAKEAFLARAKQLKKLKHRNIIEVQDFGFMPMQGQNLHEQDCTYLVTQYASGGSIAQRIIRGQCIPADEVKRILSPIADALHYAHINNIVHGNLHPGNLLIGERNETLLGDFSLLLHDVLPSFDGETLALPYRAPEHLQGTCTPASDQYALAVIVYQLLCGRRPYQANEREALLPQQQQEQLPAPRSLNQDISPAVESVLLQALARDPEERFPHTQAFADAYLRALMGLPMKVETRQAKPPLPKVLGTDTAIKGERSEAVGYLSPRQDSRFIVPVGRGGADPGAKAPNLPTLAKDAVDESTRHDTDEAALNGDVAEADATVIKVKSERTPTPIAAKRLGDDSTETRHSDLPAVDDSRLSQIVSADLCQGGILSKRLSGYEERPAQIEMARLVARSLVEARPAVVEAATGTGKALDVDTPIPTPTGWKRMGDLVVGDFVFDEKGHPTRVIAAFDVMYDRTCYEVVFSDGSSLVADAEHEWASYTSVDRSWAKRRRTDTYMARNFITSNQLAMLTQLITLSQIDDTLSVRGAVALIGGHHWSVYQAARQIPPSQLR